jgi:Reverse transcriptase (RNA-dependent DNA polymerase)
MTAPVATSHASPVLMTTEPAQPLPRTSALTTDHPITSIPIRTPLNASVWAEYLHSYPDSEQAAAIIDGIRHGIRVHYRGPRSRPQFCRNLPSAIEHPEAITGDIEREVAAGRIAGPFDTLPCNHLKCSPLGAVPKKNSSKIRRIHHLSWPRGHSVNDCIDDLPVELSRFDDALRMVRTLGKGCQLLKIDIESAYRHIPIHPDDRHLLGMRWNGKFYVDLCLPFGLSSAPAIFEWFSTATEWICRTVYGIPHIRHYMDDFIIGGRADTDQCLTSRRLLQAAFARLGWPISQKKLALEGIPSTVITYLGISIDTERMVAFIDPGRLKSVLAALDSWKDRTHCSLRELESLTGTLAFVAKVIQPGAMFIRRMYDLFTGNSDTALTKAANRNRQIKLDDGFHADLRYWQTFLPSWNGVNIIYDSTETSASALQLYTDASVHGFGASYGKRWFSSEWTTEEKAVGNIDIHGKRSTAWMEMFAIVVAANTWGSEWKGKRISFHCDNAATVAAVIAQTTASKPLMALIRTLWWLGSIHQFTIRIQHIAGTDNRCADLLSRGQSIEFLQLSAHSNRSPDTLLRPAILH